MRLATFNVQNLRLRPSDGVAFIDGASDDDATGVARTPALAHADRIETARIIAESRADFVALQEVFDLATLDFFNEHYLVPAGANSYAHRYCIKGNDGRGMNVAALSRIPARLVRSHATETGADLGLIDLPAELRDAPIFRRDCLQIELDTVSLFICHFKAPYPDPVRASRIRSAEARAVRRIIESRFVKPADERWLVLGDFNEPAQAQTATSATSHLLRDGFAVDLLDRLSPGRDWTYETPRSHLHTRPDRILASPRLAGDYGETLPHIIRSGMGADRSETGGTTPDRAPRASDHALVYADFPGL